MKETSMENVAVARALFDALASDDDVQVRALCAPGFTLRQNGGLAMDVEMLLHFNRLVHAVVSGFCYEDVVCAATATGFVEEHAVRGTLADGSALALSACVVADIVDGRVTLVREYVDTAAAAPLLAALARR
jgi:ketosteroid isomerase-like protein